MTIDANVFVSALTSSDSTYSDSLNFVGRVRTERLRAICPSLVLPECAGAIMRPTGSLPLTQRAVAFVQTMPDIRFVPLTVDRAEEAARIAASYHLGGADAVYAAVAQEFGTTLITWDQELLLRGASVITVLTPTDWLAANPTI